MERNEDTSMIKAVLLDSITLVNYCNDKNISIEKLKQANMIKLPKMYAFTRPSNFKLPKDAIGLEYDIETQPRPLLGIDILEDGKLNIVETEYTYELKI